MGKQTPSARVERALEEARGARADGRPEEAVPRLAAAAALAGTGPVRRQLRVALQHERGLCHLDLDALDDARRALLAALDAAGPEASLADPVRATLATVDLMEDAPKRAQKRLGERGRDRRPTLLAQARVHLHQGATQLAEGVLQAAEQAPGGSLDLAPPSAALRSLCAIWEGRPEQARMLLDGVADPNNPWWQLVRILLLRSQWVITGDARYLALATGAAEQLRFESASTGLAGLEAAAAGHHALLLILGGQVALGLEAADEALHALGPLSLPEWPRIAVLHDLAVVYRDADQPERWQRVLDALGDTPRGSWPDRMRQLTGPRAVAALDPPIATDSTPAGPGTLGHVALALLEGRDAPARSLLRGLLDALGGHGAVWQDADEREIAAAGSAWCSSDEDDADLPLALPGGDRLLLRGCREADLARLDLDELGRLFASARDLVADRARVRSLRDALDRAEGRRDEAVEALERARRGPAAAIIGGRFPTVAGRSRPIREALDRLGHLASTTLPVVLEGPSGSGRRHLARALQAHQSGSPERCPVLDAGLVPPDAMEDTLRRLEAEAAGGSFVVAHAEQLTPGAASTLVSRAEGGDLRGRLVITLHRDADGPVADALRRAFAPGRVVVPGLGERTEDLPQLIDALAVACGRRPEHIGTGARAVLARRSWPGHVAELRDLLARAIVRAGKGHVLPEHLEAAEADAASTSLSESLDLGYHDAVRDFRRQLLRHALTTTEGNRTRAAELLGVQRTYFMRLIRDLGADDIRPAS
ncbi:MAG: helix-turn-helix domain-containing protein [Myxococcota bacterium]